MICLDSDCIIDFLKGKKEAIEAIKRYNNQLFTTEINLFEIFFGIYNQKEISEKEKLTAEEFFDAISTFSFSRGCGEISARILSSLEKKGLRIDQNDAFTASIILRNGFDKILTRNKKHFSRIKNLKVITY
ncbi:MAG: type II toxin-antitoxin system VapC family toxin [archaeon]